MIHLSQARKIMQKSSFAIDFLSADGRCIHIDSAVSLKWNFENGTRTIKILANNQIRRIRDVLITHLNDSPVYL